jgi:hypothetical protein
MEPYATMHIDMQAGKFDNSHCVFTSIGITSTSVISQLNDYRELWPEFFSEPEFLVNADDFDLGRATGRLIESVPLPLWARSPIEPLDKFDIRIQTERRVGTCIKQFVFDRNV